MHETRALRRRLYTAVSVVALATAGAARGEPATFFSPIADGRSSFDTQITDVGGTVTTDQLDGPSGSPTSEVRTGYTIDFANGATLTGVPNFFASVTSGVSILTTAYSTGITSLGFDETAEWDAPPSAAADSALRFTFSSAVNAFGFELDDWATCCLASSLYLAFDGGTPIRVATALATDGDATASGDDKAAGPSIYRADSVNSEVFIGAIDDSGTFNSITFFGVAVGGDALFAGGTIRYALIPVGSLGGSGYVDTSAGTHFEGLAQALDRVDGSGTLATIATTLNSQSESELEDSLQMIFPVNLASVNMQVMTDVGGFRQPSFSVASSVTGSLPALVSGSTNLSQPDGLVLPAVDVTSASGAGDLAAQLAATPYQRFEIGADNIWLSGLGSRTNGGPSGLSEGFDSRTYGIAAGYDWALSDTLVLGATTGFAASRLEFDENLGDTDAQTYTVGGYLSKLIDTVKVTGFADLGYSRYHGTRNIDIGAVQATAKSRLDGLTHGTGVEVTHLWTHDDFEIEPMARLALYGTYTESFSESGAGALNLDVGGDYAALATGEIGLGLRYSREMEAGELGIRLRPFLRQQVEIEKSDAQVAFVGGTTSSAVNGRSLDLSSAGAGIEVNFEGDDGFKLNVGSTGAFSTKEISWAGFVRVGYTW